MLTNKILLWVVIYFGCLILYKLFSHIEHRKHPEKLARYNILPLRIKLTCAFVALQIFATSIFGAFENNVALSYLWILALIIALWLETKAVEHYKKNGLF